MNQKTDFKKYLLIKGIVITVSILSIFGCQVVKLEDQTSKKGFTVYFEDKEFNSDKMVTDLWDSKIIPYIIEKSNDIVVVVDEIYKDKENAGQKYAVGEKEEGRPLNFIVSGEGTIKNVDKTSRAGKMYLDFPSIKNSEIIIQTGPVIQGTSLRDSFDFISFDQFTNQIEFANYSKSLSKQVSDKVFENIELDQNVGKTLKFFGTFTMPVDLSKIIITPVKIELL